MTDEQIMNADSASSPDVYAVATMLQAIGAIGALAAPDNSYAGKLIRQLEVAIDKLRRKQ